MATTSPLPPPLYTESQCLLHWYRDADGAVTYMYENSSGVYVTNKKIAAIMVRVGKPTLYTQSQCLVHWYRHSYGKAGYSEAIYIRDHGNGHSTEYELRYNGVITDGYCLWDAFCLDDFVGDWD